ncbi:MAG: acyl-CoA dehydrogenase family protein [Sphingomonadaceae bacterium]|nr:acyl-CoA dehydrogenase family protein [Sphingomonadaceae bacterium]
MDFDFSEEQELLRHSLTRFAADRYGLDKRRHYLASELGYSRDNWRLLAELGMLGLTIPEEYGGMGLGEIERYLVMEQFGRCLLTEPYLASAVLAADLLLAADSEAKHVDNWLPRIAAGEAVVAAALAEPEARYERCHVGLRAQADGQAFRLTERKCAVLYAEHADALIVSARSSGGVAAEDGISLFLVPPAAPGLSMRPYRLADGTPVADIIFDNVLVGEDALIGTPGTAYPALSLALDKCDLALSASAIGAMRAIFDATLAYVQTRQQFGRKIGSFQAVQHRLADALVRIEMAESLALRLLAEEPAEGTAHRRLRAGLRALVAETAIEIGHEGIQLHGGMGMTDELDVSHYHKHIMVVRSLFGDPDHHWRRYATLARAA